MVWWWWRFEGPIRFKMYILYGFSETKFIKIHSIIYGDDTLIWKINSVQHLRMVCSFFFRFYSIFSLSLRWHSFLVRIYTRLQFFSTSPTSTSRRILNNHTPQYADIDRMKIGVCRAHLHHFRLCHVYPFYRFSFLEAVHCQFMITNLTNACAQAQAMRPHTYTRCEFGSFCDSRLHLISSVHMFVSCWKTWTPFLLLLFRLVVVGSVDGSDYSYASNHTHTPYTVHQIEYNLIV